MDDDNEINPNADNVRAILRVIGPLIVIVGLIFLIVGLASFFSSFGSFEPPRYFWCAFVGMPLFGIGIGITKFAFLGSFLRYVAGETAPVAKDTFDYVAKGSSDGVRSLAQAVREGLTPPAVTAHCPKCQHENARDAQFCNSCGQRLASKACPKCHVLNPPDAKFCDHCGEAIA